MKHILARLLELDIHIPDNLDDESLLRLAKRLNPWTVTVEPHPEEAGTYRAYTRKDLTGEVFCANTPHEAALGLLLYQLDEKRFTSHDTTYKTSAANRRHV